MPRIAELPPAGSPAWRDYAHAPALALRSGQLTATALRPVRHARPERLRRRGRAGRDRRGRLPAAVREGHAARAGAAPAGAAPRAARARPAHGCADAAQPRDRDEPRRRARIHARGPHGSVRDVDGQPVAAPLAQPADSRPRRSCKLRQQAVEALLAARPARGAARPRSRTSGISSACSRGSRCARRGRATSRSCATVSPELPDLKARFAACAAALRLEALGAACGEHDGERELLGRALVEAPPVLLRDGGVIAPRLRRRARRAARDQHERGPLPRRSRAARTRAHRHRNTQGGLQPRARLLHRDEQGASGGRAGRLHTPADAERRGALHHPGAQGVRGQGA